MSRYYILTIASGLIMLIALLVWLAFFQSVAPARYVSLLGAWATIRRSPAM